MPSWACSQRSFSRLISWSRPVSGDSPAGSAASIGLRATRRAHPEELDGLGHPLDLPVAEEAQLNCPWIRRWVDSLHRPDRRMATSSSRTATFRASPTSETAPAWTRRLPARCGCRPTDATPACCGGETALPRAFISSRIARPARAAGRPRPRRPRGSRSTPAAPCRCTEQRFHRTAHRPLARLLEGPQHAGLILRVECQERLGLEQVAAAHQNGHLAALRLAAGTLASGRQGIRSNGRRCWRSLSGHRPWDGRGRSDYPGFENHTGFVRIRWKAEQISQFRFQRGRLRVAVSGPLFQTLENDSFNVLR